MTPEEARRHLARVIAMEIELAYQAGLAAASETAPAVYPGHREAAAAIGRAGDDARAILEANGTWPS